MPCPCCGAPVAALAGAGRPPTYCSERCRRATERTRARIKSLEAWAAHWYRIGDAQRGRRVEAAIRKLTPRPPPTFSSLSAPLSASTTPPKEPLP